MPKIKFNKSEEDFNNSSSDEEEEIRMLEKKYLKIKN